MTWKLFDKAGNQVKEGDEIADFREKLWTVIGMYPPGSSGGASGKVSVKPSDGKGMNMHFFPHVFKCKFREVEEVQHNDGPAADFEISDAPKGTLRYDRDMAREKGYDE